MNAQIKELTFYAVFVIAVAVFFLIRAIVLFFRVKKKLKDLEFKAKNLNGAKELDTLFAELLEVQKECWLGSQREKVLIIAKIINIKLYYI